MYTSCEKFQRERAARISPFKTYVWATNAARCKKNGEKKRFHLETAGRGARARHKYYLKQIIRSLTLLARGYAK